MRRLRTRASRAHRLARQQLARLPFLTARAMAYDTAYFQPIDAVHRPMYRELAHTLARTYRPRSVIDVGCGTGMMLTYFFMRGLDIVGLEGSQDAINASQVAPYIRRLNLERKLPPLGRFDLAVCVEVAEHLRPRRARSFVDDLCQLSDRIVFTAAQPGQGGRLHLNEREPAYWTGLFAEHGFVVADMGAVRDAISGIPEPAWMHENLRVFERRAHR